ncbi:MAG: AraC family transcriptional regulator [Puniceicoccaceae bacterium]|nr:AraC family transcriptional regulator [Puniceicoccaceae bacterium]
MKSYRLELSSHIKRGRYANFQRESEGAEGLFMLGYEECEPDYIIERNSFPFWGLEFVAGGEGFYREGEQQRTVRYGAVFTYGPGIDQRWGNKRDRPFKKYFLIRGGAEFPQLWKDAGLHPGRMIQLGNASPVVAVFDQLLDEGGHGDAKTAQILGSLESVLLALIERHKGTARGDLSASRKVYDMTMDVLQRDYREIASLAELAKRVGYSGEYLCRIFKKYHGESPYQVLLHRKMSAAWLLLRDGELQVGAVAREIGFDDQLHFSRVFRKVMGCAPSAV